MAPTQPLSPTSLFSSIMHYELPIASFISATLSLAPLPWHWRAGTVPTISISLWLFISNLINGANTIVWANNLSIVAPVWCDISEFFLLCSHPALINTRRYQNRYGCQCRSSCFDILLVHSPRTCFVYSTSFDESLSETPKTIFRWPPLLWHPINLYGTAYVNLLAEFSPCY